MVVGIAGNDEQTKRATAGDSIKRFLDASRHRRRHRQGHAGGQGPKGVGDLPAQ